MSLVIDTPKEVLISINLVDDKRMLELNKEYKGKDAPTDVLSFNIDDDMQNKYYLGDIVVNKDQARRQAQEYGNTMEEEISQLVSHGILHLLGVHHDGDDH
ncbi:MAG: rRNA maturation RNase YbeY [Patescibacteria group bacterium]|jgi:probable rRNA maturation factor